MNWFQRWVGRRALSKETEELKPTLLERDYIVFDFETTGFSAAKGDRVISLGAVKVLQGRIQRQNPFYALVDPKRVIPQIVEELTGIRNEDVAGRDSFEIIMPQFLRWANEDTDKPMIAGHAVDFDLSFLGSFFREDPLFEKALDSRVLISLVYPGLGNKSLFHIAEYLECSILKEHNALEDALLSAQVLLMAFQELKNQNITTFDSLERMIKQKNLILPNHY